MTLLGLLVYYVLLVVRPQDWVAAVLYWRLELTVVIVTIVLGLMRFLNRDEGEGDRTWPIQLPFVFLWPVAIFLSNAINGNVADGLSFGLDYFKRSLIFFMFWLALDRTWKLRALAVLIVALTALLGLQGIHQVRDGVGWAGQAMYWGGRINWVGLWDGANVLSLLFVMAIPFALEMILSAWPFPFRIAGLLGLGLIVQGMILASSRGAWLALGVTLLFYAVRRIGGMGMVVGGVAMAAVMAAGPSRSLAMDSSADGKSASQRVDMWAEGLEMLKYNPVLGIGKGQFAGYTGSLIAHNSFVQNMGETGLVGYYLWLGAIFLSFRLLMSLSRVSSSLSPPLSSATRAVHAALVGYLATSFFITTDFEPLYILMALAAVCFDLARRELGPALEIPFKPADLGTIAGLEVATIVVMYAVTAALSATLSA
jgi:O-antigen ligase